MVVVPVTAPAPALVMAAGVAWPPLCTLAVGLRFYARRYLRQDNALDDWLTVPALILLWGQGIAVIVGTASKALAYPSPSPPPGVDPTTFSSFEGRMTRQIFWAMLLLQIPALTCNKLSFVALYRRIFAGRRSVSTRDRGCRVFRAVTAAVAVLLVVWAVVFFLSELFICRARFVDIWESKSTVETAATCLDLTTWDQAFTVSDFVLDLVIFVLPIVPVARLNLTVAQRFAVAGAFSLGGLAVAASVARLVIFFQELQNDESQLADVDLIMTACLYWTIMESGLALLAACLPAIYGLLNKVRQNSQVARSYEMYGPEDGHGSSNSGNSKNGSKNSSSNINSSSC